VLAATASCARPDDDANTSQTDARLSSLYLHDWSSDERTDVAWNLHKPQKIRFFVCCHWSSGWSGMTSGPVNAAWIWSPVVDK